jgi:hypothetical protein
MKKFPWDRSGKPNKPSKDMGKHVKDLNDAVKGKDRTGDTPKPKQFIKSKKGC